MKKAGSQSSRDLLIQDVRKCPKSRINEFCQMILFIYRARIATYLTKNCELIFSEFLRSADLDCSLKRKSMANPSVVHLPLHLKLAQEYVRVINRDTNTWFWEHKTSLKRFSIIHDLEKDFKRRKHEALWKEKKKQSKWCIIVRGHFSQNIFSRTGSQCTAIAATSIVYAYRHGPSTFNSNTLDEILWLGEQYYHICRQRCCNQDEYLTAKEIEGEFCVQSSRVLLQVPENEDSNLNGWNGILNNVPGDEHIRLESTLELFWNAPQYLYAIITMNSKSIAILKDEENETIYVFDSHPNDIIGESSLIGTACMKAYNPCPQRFQNISNDLHNNNATSGEAPEYFQSLSMVDQLSLMYSVTPVKVLPSNVPHAG